MTFKSNYRAVKSEMEKAVDRALEIVGGMAESDIKVQLTINRSVDTGNLRNSITHARFDDKTEIVGTDVFYAPYVELGTVKMKAKPYMRPALENHRDDYKKVIQNEIAGR